MSINELSKLDWSNRVPNLHGDLIGDNFVNLSRIAGSTLISNSEIQRKCWRFATLQDSGKETYRAGKILVENNISAKKEEVVFKDGTRHKVELYKLAALKKDFPQFKIQLLNQGSLEEFNDLISFLYEGDVSNKDANLKLLKKYGIDDPAILMMHSDYELMPSDVNNCPTRALPRLAQAIVSKYTSYKDPIPRDIKDVNVNLVLNAFMHRIRQLDPKNRVDVSVGAQLYQIFNNPNAIISGAAGLKGSTKEFLSGTTEGSKEAGFFKRIILALARFMHDSFLNWFDADREFVVNVLKSIPNLHLQIKGEISESMLGVLCNMQNIATVSFPDHVSREYKNMLDDKFVQGIVRYYK